MASRRIKTALIRGEKLCELLLGWYDEYRSDPIIRSRVPIIPYCWMALLEVWGEATRQDLYNQFGLSAEMDDEINWYREQIENAPSGFLFTVAAERDLTLGCDIGRTAPFGNQSVGNSWTNSPAEMVGIIERRSTTDLPNL